MKNELLSLARFVLGRLKKPIQTTKTETRTPRALDTLQAAKCARTGPGPDQSKASQARKLRAQKIQNIAAGLKMMGIPFSHGRAGRLAAGRPMSATMFYHQPAILSHE